MLPVWVHLLAVWMVPSLCAVVALEWMAALDGLENLDLVLVLLAITLLLGSVGALSRAVVPTTRTLPGLALWTVAVTALGTVGAVVTTLVVLGVQAEAGVLPVSALAGLPFVVTAGFFVPVRGLRIVLATVLVIVVGLGLALAA